MLGACVSAETTTRRHFPRKPVKKSRVAQPVLDALDRASIIVAYEENTRAHSSVGPRESRLRTWGRLYFCWLDDTVDVLPLTPGKIRAVSAFLQHRSYSSGMANISVIRCLSRVGPEDTSLSSLSEGDFGRPKQRRSFVRTFLLIRCDAVSLPLTVFKRGCTRQGCTTHPRVLLRCLFRPRMPFSRRCPRSTFQVL